MTIATDIVIIWPSTNASIPSGWTRDTALDGKYIKGAPNATGGGGTGGAANHTHTSTAHSHNDISSHNHTTTLNSGNAGSLSALGEGGANNSSHSHSAGTHGSTSATVSSTAATLGNANNDPSNVKVIFIKSDGTPTGIPSGGVVLTTETSYASGWYLADGNNSTSNIGANFVTGAGSGADSNLTATGSSTHTHTGTSTHTLGAHTHTNATSGSADTGAGSGIGGSGVARGSSPHTHTIVLNTTATGTISDTFTMDSVTNEPNYKKIGFLQNKNAGASDTTKMIAIWKGTIASIPANWVLCDGTAGTPDLRDYWIKGETNSANFGGTGGYSGAGVHNHTANSHTHSIGHSHTVSSANSTTTLVRTGTDTSVLQSGIHGHTTTVSTNTQTSSSTTATIENNSDSRPPYYEILFIMYSPAATIRNQGFII